MGKTQSYVDIVNLDRDYWENLYLTKSLTEFCQELGVTVQSCGNVIKQLGWGREFKREKTYEKLNCWLDEETDMKYYFLGFFVGDGSLREPRDSYAREYTIYSKDREVLEVFAEKMGVQVRSRTHKRAECEEYLVRSCNRKEWDWLYSWGMRPNKSKNGMELGYIPEEYKYSFLRGLLDADGHVKVTPNGKRVESFQWVGHESYMRQVFDLLKEEFTPTIRTDKNLTVIFLGKKEQVFSLRDKMYTGIAIKRKKARAYINEEFELSLKL